MVVPCADQTPRGDVRFDDYFDVFSVPSNPLGIGDVVRFHDLGTHTADHVQGLWSASGSADYCVKFLELGAYPYRCYFHSQEQGTIDIQVF